MKITCKCGCGQEVKLGKIFIRGHYFQGKKRPEQSKLMKERMKGNSFSKGKPKSEKTKQKMREFWTSEIKKKKSEQMSGENNVMFGRKRPEISGKNNVMSRPEILAKFRGENSPIYQRMKNGGAAYANSFIKNPSKPQVKLYEKIKVFFPNAILNYPFQNYSIDIAMPDLKVAIEYDGKYWHKGREKEDQKRQKEIEKEGWKFLRYSQIPNDGELIQNLFELEERLYFEERYKKHNI